jgi:plastocyanin
MFVMDNCASIRLFLILLVPFFGIIFLDNIQDDKIFAFKAPKPEEIDKASTNLINDNNSNNQSDINTNNSLVAATNSKELGVSIVPGAPSLTNTAYSPNPIEIGIGDTVIWTNNDDAFHTVTSGIIGAADSGELFDSGLGYPMALAYKGNTFKHTFNTAGEFPYHCTLHPTMNGIVVVSSNITDSAPSAVTNPSSIIGIDNMTIAGSLINSTSDRISLNENSSNFTSIVDDTNPSNNLSMKTNRDSDSKDDSDSIKQEIEETMAEAGISFSFD